jgi:hypothetical protein
MPDLPKHLEAYAQDCRKLFGLDEWSISVIISETPPEHQDDSRWHGDVDHDPCSLTATIRLHWDATDEEQRDTMMHEMLHIALGLLNLANRRVVELLPEELHEHADALFNDALEQTVTRMTRALQREIKPAVKVEEAAR